MIDAILDTSVLIDLIRLYPPAIEWFQANTELSMATTVVNVMEMLQGARSNLNMTNVRRSLRPFDVIYLDEDDQRWAVQQLTRFHLSHGVGYSDCLIASAAHRLRLPLYTANLKHLGVVLPDFARQPY